MTHHDPKPKSQELRALSAAAADMRKAADVVRESLKYATNEPQREDLNRIIKGNEHIARLLQEAHDYREGIEKKLVEISKHAWNGTPTAIQLKKLGLWRDYK